MTTNTATRTARRRMTHAAFTAEGIRRFGKDPKQWLFRCSNCQRPQKATDLPRHRAADVAQACFGCGRTVDEAKGDERARLWRITLPDGTKTDSFPLADELDSPEGHSGPLGAVQALAATGTPARATDAPTPPAAPVRAASSPMPPTAYWVAGRGWVHAGDLDPCECHIAPPCVRCESLQVCEHCPTEVFVHVDEMDAHLAAIHPEIAESEA